MNSFNIKGVKMAFLKMILLLLLLSSINVSGQKPFFRNIKVPDQVNETTITCLYQDLNSYMWIGTGKGVYKFDGNNFIYYPGTGKEATLQVSSVFMTPDQVLWIGTRKGDIYNFKGDSLRLFNPEEGNPKVAITGFTLDEQGNLWFSTYGEGVYYYDGKRISNLNTDDGLTDNYCYSVVTDKYGRIWVATDGGISVCSISDGKKSISTITTSDGLPDNIVLSLTSDENFIWAGMQDAGICKIAADSKKISVPESSLTWPYGPVKDIVTGANWLWLSTERNGIISLEKETGTISGNYKNNDNVSFQRINKLYADRQGNYWIASGNQLLLTLGHDLLHFSENGKVIYGNIHSLLADKNGNTWFSNDEGLFRLDSRTGTTQRISLPLKKHLHIISLYEDDKGYIWAGTFGSGLFCVHPVSKRSRLYSEEDGLSNGNVLSISGRGNQIWLATLGGAYKCVVSGDPVLPGTQVNFMSYGDQNFPGNNYIYSVFIDSRNRIWFGTDGKGISMIENGRFANFNMENGLKSNVIYSIAEDSDGDIWFSTSNAGIYRYNGKTFRNYSVSDGLSDLHITGLLADKNHHLLVIHNNGVDLLDTRSNSFLYFGSGVGLSEINPDLNVCSLTPGNIALIGTQNGIISLQVPADITTRQPSLHLDKVSVFLGPENFIGVHDFPYNKNHISFHFNALWYLSPATVRYQIRLKGFDLDWIETRDNLVTYSSLPPGSYTFEVRSSIKGNFSQSVIRSFTFTIKKPLWQTTWFIIVSVLAIALLLYFFIHLREKAIRKRDANEREKLMFQFQTLRSQVNPHFLFNSFSTLITIIDEDKDVAIEYVEKLSQFFRDILDYRDKDLIPLSEELQLIDTYYFLQKKRYCQNLQLETEVNKNELQSLVPPMVLQMLVENSIKHNVVSADKPLIVKIYTDGKHIVVANNLQPKKAGVPSTGIGLTNIRNRYMLLGCGEVVIDSSEDQFIVKLPLIYTQR